MNMKSTPSTLDDYIASQGRRGDTLVAHLSKREAGLLKKMGGSGSINPRTGMLEFYDGDESSSASTDTGADTSGGFGGDESSSASTDTGPDTSMGFGPADPPGIGSADLEGPAMMGDPTGVYGMMEGVKDLNPVGGFLGKYGNSMLLGYGLMGPPGLAVGPMVKGLKDSIMSGEFGKLSPEEQAQAIATAEGAMPDRGGGGEIGGAGTTTEAILGPQMQELEKMYKRAIAQEPYTYNLQMAGLSPRDVLPARRF